MEKGKSRIRKKTNWSQLKGEFHQRLWDCNPEPEYEEKKRHGSKIHLREGARRTHRFILSRWVNSGYNLTKCKEINFPGLLYAPLMVLACWELSHPMQIRCVPSAWLIFQFSLIFEGQMVKVLFGRLLD